MKLKLNWEPYDRDEWQRPWIGKITDYEFHPIEARRERSWVAAHPERFERVLRNWAGELYRVKRGEE